MASVEPVDCPDDPVDPVGGDPDDPVDPVGPPEDPVPPVEPVGEELPDFWIVSFLVADDEKTYERITYRRR